MTNFKFQVQSETEEQPERVIFGLKKEKEGICLYARKQFSLDSWMILRINNDGTLKKIGNIDDDIGLQVNNEGFMIES